MNNIGQADYREPDCMDHAFLPCTGAMFCSFGVVAFKSITGAFCIPALAATYFIGKYYLGPSEENREPVIQHV